MRGEAQPRYYTVARGGTKGAVRQPRLFVAMRVMCVKFLLACTLSGYLELVSKERPFLHLAGTAFSSSCVRPSAALFREQSREQRHQLIDVRVFGAP